MLVTRKSMDVGTPLTLKCRGMKRCTSWLPESVASALKTLIGVLSLKVCHRFCRIIVGDMKQWVAPVSRRGFSLTVLLSFAMWIGKCIAKELGLYIDLITYLWSYVRGARDFKNPSLHRLGFFVLHFLVQFSYCLFPPGFVIALGYLPQAIVCLLNYILVVE